jgi:hypothetical protein
MLSKALKLALLLCGLHLLPCHSSAVSILVGDWESISLDANVIGRATYSADQTWSACVDDPRNGSFRGSGVWRIKGSQIISTQAWENFRAAVREAVEHPSLEIAPGVYSGGPGHIFSRESNFDEPICPPEELEHTADPFPIKPYTLPGTASETLRRDASNQALQLTADRREEQFYFYETFSDISTARSRQR